MKTSLFLTLLLICALAILPSAVSAQTTTPPVTDEYITLYNSHIELKKDGSVTVQEEVLYNFGTTRHHGVYRVIPLTFKRGDNKEVTVAVTNLIVSDGKGNVLPSEVDGGGNFVSMKIGDPEKEVSGEVLYVIHYTLLGAVLPSLDASQDVFYWDAIGSAWPAPIVKARVEVVLPDILPKKEVDFNCFYLSQGNGFPCEENHQVGTATGTLAVLRFTKENLNPHESMLVAVAVKHGVVKLPRSIDRRHYSFSPWYRSITPSLWLLLPTIIALICIAGFNNRTERLSLRQMRSYVASGVGLVAISIFVSPALGFALFLTGVVVLIASVG